MKQKVSSLYMLCGVLFTTCLLISNIAAFKLIQLGPFTVTAAVLLFPITYILNDVFAEVYGYKSAQRIIWTGFAMNVLMVLFFQITIALPAPVFFQDSSMYAKVLGNTPRILISSLLAFLSGSFVNATIMSRMKVLTNGKYLAARAIVSTLFGETVDSAIFITLAFIGTMSTKNLITMIVVQFSLKTLYEIIIYPVTRIVIQKFKSYEQADPFDRNVSYNPFKK